eukprot:scaffold39251_cov77-Cyclotella_meneghiniana.AAC.16
MKRGWNIGHNDGCYGGLLQCTSAFLNPSMNEVSKKAQKLAGFPIKLKTIENTVLDRRCGGLVVSDNFEHSSLERSRGTADSEATRNDGDELTLA